MIILHTGRKYKFKLVLNEGLSVMLVDNLRRMSNTLPLIIKMSPRHLFLLRVQLYHAFFDFLNLNGFCPAIRRMGIHNKFLVSHS